jgi:hypothetical protein
MTLRLRAAPGNNISLPASRLPQPQQVVGVLRLLQKEGARGACVS